MHGVHSNNVMIRPYIIIRVSYRNLFWGGGGGGNLVSGEQWVCKARLLRGGVGVLPQKFSEKVSALS